MTVRSRFQVRDPAGAIEHLPGADEAGFFDDLQAAIDACASRNATEGANFQHVVVPVIHAPGT